MADLLPTGWDRLDPAALAVARMASAALPAPVRELGVATARLALASPPAEQPLTPLDRVEDVAVPTRSGPRRARWYHAPTPSGSARPVLLYLHGGGFVLGTLDGVDEVCRAIAAWSGWDVVSLEYRLAPEHPYPAALEDVIDTVSWLRGSAAEMGIDPEAVAVGGDSAGGNLAAASCLWLRDHGDQLPITQVLVYPPVDDRFASPAWTTFAEGPVLTAPDAHWLWEQYVGVDPAVDEYAAPMTAATLRGLPPALVVTAEVDVLRDDAEAFAERLRTEGVAVTVIRHAGVFHGFFTEPATFVQAKDALDQVAAHLLALRSRPPHGHDVAPRRTPSLTEPDRPIHSGIDGAPNSGYRT